METYRIRGKLYTGIVSKEQFIKEIEVFLRENPFSTIEEISFGLRADQKAVENVLKDYIVGIVKNNIGINFNRLCREYKIKTNYVEELIEEGRLEIPVPANKNEIEAEQAKAKEASSKAALLRGFQDARSSMNSLNSSPSLNDNKISTGFHSHRR